MSEFLTSLFNSIFTPGATPTLVLATNASFAALQLVLLCLVIATLNIHFFILSFLCGGLWLAINWFVREIETGKATQAGQEGTHAGQGRRIPGSRRGRRRNGKGDGMGEGEAAGEESADTEVEDVEIEETEIGQRVGKQEEESGKKVAEEKKGEDEGLRLRVKSEDEKLRKRGSYSDVSVSGTDSEWDKVSEAEGGEL